MRSSINTILLAALMSFITTASSASFLDGKTPLLCSVYQLFECDPPNACVAVTPDEIQGVSHLNIDFSKKIVTKAGEVASRTARPRCATARDGPSPSWTRRAPWCWRSPVTALR